jgi:hypothetical protein
VVGTPATIDQGPKLEVSNVEPRRRRRRQEYMVGTSRAAELRAHRAMIRLGLIPIGSANLLPLWRIVYLAGLCRGVDLRIHLLRPMLARDLQPSLSHLAS